MAVKTWILLADSELKKKKSRISKPRAWGSSPHFLRGAQDQRLGAEQDQLPCGHTGTFSGNCQETETCMVRACQTPR